MWGHLLHLLRVNLSLDSHYKDDNMYLIGLVPGTDQLHCDQLNYFLDPLINDMVNG